MSILNNSQYFVIIGEILSLNELCDMYTYPSRFNDVIRINNLRLDT